MHLTNPPAHERKAFPATNPSMLGGLALLASKYRNLVGLRLDIDS